MKNKIKIFLAAPRGFCAGVDRAIEIVKKTLNKYGSPVYVRHEIVNNKNLFLPFLIFHLPLKFQFHLILIEI